jgi:hypothetical protein
VKENAPSVLEMVAEHEALAGDEGGTLGGKKPKETRIREIQNEMEEPWCCVNGLAPVKSVCGAVMLCFINIILPGFGTILSGCTVKSSDPSEDDTK